MSRLHISVDGRKLLVERVASSRYVGKSARLRALLVYLCDQVLERDAQEIHEQEVGRAVFGRPADYDTVSDNIVRVHASMLRKRLNEYFSSEGRDEVVIIEIPKGNYAPIFSERRVTEIVTPLVQPVLSSSTPGIVRRMDWRIGLLAGLVALFATLSLLFLMRGKAASSLPQLFSARPAVHEFWSQIFVPGSKTDIVMDDEGVGLFQQLTGTRIALSDYFNRNYLRELTEKSSLNKLSGDVAGSIVLKRQSSYASTNLLWKLSELATEVNGQGAVHFARDYSFRELKVNNAILLGNSLSNPWIEPFESRLGLRWKYDGAHGGYYPVDTWAPLATRNRFRATGDGYAMIAMLPNLGGVGKILIVSSSGGSAMNGAGNFLADNESVARMKTLLPHTQRDKFPYFEVLLRVKSQSRLPRDTSVVICRLPRG